MQMYETHKDHGSGSESSNSQSDSESADSTSEEEESDEVEEVIPRKRPKIAIEYITPPILPTNLTQLIQLAQHCKDHPDIHFRDTKNLAKSLPHLQQLENLIGLQSIKQQINKHILLYLQQADLPVLQLPHIKMYGMPGVGKTTVLNIFAKIMSCLNPTKNATVVFGQMPSDFIAPALGQTAPKTRRMFERAKHGFLAIDEAHNISDNRHAYSSDSYSKNCADVINQYLTEQAHLVTVIVAGYEKEMMRDFFSINPGLLSRFPTTFRFEPYSASELQQIAMQKLKQQKFIVEELPISIFENATLFSAQGRDVASFVDKVCLLHAQQVFGLKEKYTMNNCIIETALDELKKEKHI